MPIIPYENLLLYNYTSTGRIIFDMMEECWVLKYPIYKTAVSVNIDCERWVGAIMPHSLPYVGKFSNPQVVIGGHEQHKLP